MLYSSTHSDDSVLAVWSLLLLCAFYVRADTVISRNGMKKVADILYLPLFFYVLIDVKLRSNAHATFDLSAS